MADDPDDVGVLTATDAPVPAPSLRPAEPGEGSQAAEAAAARATIARLPRQRVAPPVQATPSTQTEPVPPGGNFFSQFRNDPVDDGVELAERNRLNRQDGFYRGSLAGSMRLSALAHIYETPDGPDVTPERKAVNDEMRAEYQRVVADLAKHDMIPGFGSTAEALVAFAGQLEGTMISPESWIGWGAKGATWLARTLSAAGQQAVIQGVTDPVIQAANIGAGVKDQYDPVQTVLSMGLGGVIGAGGHQVGEIGGRLMTRRMLADLGKMDSAYVNSVIEAEMGALERGVVPRTDVSRETAGAAPPAEPPAPRDYGPGPEYGFDDTVTRMEESADPRKLTKRDGKVTIHGVGGENAKRDAKWAAFREETGDALDLLLAKYEQPPEVGVAIADFYNRQPGEHPMAALENAFRDWYEGIEERMAIMLSDPDTPASKLKADYDQADRIQADADRASRAQPFTYEEGKLGNFGTGQGEIRTLQGMSPGAGLTGRIAQDVPFEPAGSATKGGDFPESGRPPAREEGGVSGGGAGGATGGGRGGERPSTQAAAIGTERLSNPRDIVVALRITDDAGNVQIVRGKKGDLHEALVDQVPPGAKIDDDGFFDTAANRYLTRDEAAKAVGIDEGRVLAEAQKSGAIRLPDRRLPEGTEMVLFPHDEGAGFTIRIQDEGTSQTGALHYEIIVGEPDKNGVAIVDEALNKSLRFRGLGEMLYEKAIATARENGWRLSGFGSESAQRVWKSLEARGLAEKIGPEQYAAVDVPKTERAAQDEQLTGPAVLKNGERVEFVVPKDADAGTISIDAIGKDGDVIGSFVAKDGRILDAWVDTPYRRQGLATEAYNRIERALGEKLQAANALTEDGRKFRASRYAVEKTDQGEQTLIPGVEPITDRQRLDTQADKPMQGGDAPPPAGGLFDTDARAQGDLLGRAIPDGDAQNIAQRRKGGKMEGESVRPDEGIAGAPSPEKDLAIRSLQQQSFDLAKALNFPLRQGRVQSRGAAGQFQPRTGVVRVLEVPDFEVVSHEAGHALEARAGKPLTDLTEQFETELRPLDYDKDPTTGLRVNEGFAEWVRLFLNNPAYAERQAPGFTTAFRAFMQKQHPDLLATLDATAANKIAYDKASSVDAVGAVVRSYNEDEHVVKETLAALKKKEMPPVIKAFMHESYTALFDKYAPMTQAIREMAIAIRDKSGVPVDLKAAYNPEKMIRLLDRSRQGAVDALQYGVTPRDSVTPEGANLTDALVLATGQTSAWGAWDPVRLRDFDSYLIARRAVDLWRRFDAGELANPPVAFSPGDAAMAVRELEAAFPTFKDAGEMVQGYARQILRKKFESGLLKADSYQAILDTDGFYVPFYRDRRDLPGSGGSGTGGAMEGGPGLVDATHRIKGSSRDIYSPVESLMRDTFLMEHQVRLNDIVNALGQFGERAGVAGGKYIERIPAFEARKHVVPLGEILENKVREMGMTKAEGDAFLASMGDLAREDPLMGSFFKMEQTSGKGEPIVFSKQGGELVAWRVMSEKEGYPLYELLTAAPDAISDVWVQLIGTAAGIKRAGITTNPVFALSNYIRDQFAAAILRSDYIPILSGLRGMADEINQAPAARQYAAAGGVSGGAATGPIDRAVELEIDALRKRGFAVQRFTSFKGLLELASFTEAGTRNSIVAKVYETKKSQGLSDVEALAEAVKEAQDIMDFSRHGSRTLAIAKMIPFLNATAQGLDKARRTMIEPLWQRMRDGQVFAEDSDTFKNALMAWAKMGGLGAATGAAWAAINWEKEAYRDASVKFKATHVVVPYGNKIVVVPKPFELGLGFTLGEYAFARLMKDDQRAGGQFMEAAWDVLKLPLHDIPLVTSGTELALGKSLFTGRDIVPSALQGLPSEMQFTDRTSEAAKWLGQQTGISPIKIEYFVGSQFGNWGRDALALSQGVGEDAPAKDFDDRIFLRRFVKDPTRSSDAVTKFWDFMGRTTGKYNQSLGAYDTLVKGFQEQKAAEFLSKLPAPEKSFVTLRSAADENGKPAFSADEKRLHPLQRAYDAVTIVNGMRKEMATNNFATYEGGARIKLDPEMRRDLLDNIRELGQMEMRNALVILGEPGYKGRPMLDVNDVMTKIRHISPEVANELAVRYATAKIYKTDEIVKVWPKAQADLVRFGSGADIQGFSYQAKGSGTEFDGERVKKPPKRRAPIAGSPAGPTP